jgi:hypothetical protein
MNWYYAAGEQQVGPIEQTEFDRLVQSGTITAATLVWREGLSSWQAYGEVAAAVPPHPPAVGTPAVICSVCNQGFPLDQTIRLDNGYVCAGCKPVALQRVREGVTSNSAELIRKEHIKHEASVKSVGLLYFLAAALMLLVGIFSAVSGQGEGILIGLILLVLGAAQVWVGIGLRGLKAWARIPTAILSGLGLLGFPIGTLINGYILYLVLSAKGKTVFSDEYQRVIEQTPHIKYRTSIVVWILLGLLLLLVGAGLVAAFFGSRR